MGKRINNFQVIMFMLLISLFVPPQSVNAGSIIGTDFVISDDPEQEVFPSVAYNTTRQEYLVVWFNDRAGNDDIRAQRLDKYGAKIGSAFYISAGAGNDRRYPDVAYNSLHDQYLVVWENDNPSGYYSIRARRVSGSGSVLDSTDIVITGESNLYTPVKPAVAYGSTADRYMVVWAETWHPSPITYTIYVLEIDENGTLGSTPTQVAQSSNFLREPDIAYNRHANRHLVVWSEYNSGTTNYHIMGQQIHGGGGTYSGVITIGSHPKDCSNPAIASIPTSSSDIKFFVVYEFQYAVSDYDIYGKFIEEDGTVDTTLYLLAITYDDARSPAIAGNEQSQEYLVVWRENLGVIDKRINGIQASSQGGFLGEPVNISGPAIENPAIAAGNLADFLVVWQDQPIALTHTNIYGQMFGNRVFVPLLSK